MLLTGRAVEIPGRSGPSHDLAAAGLFPEAKTFLDLAAALRTRLSPLR